MFTKDGFLTVESMKNGDIQYARTCRECCVFYWDNLGDYCMDIWVDGDWISTAYITRKQMIQKLKELRKEGYIFFYKKPI